MAGRGSAPGERRGGRQKGTPNKATAAREAEIEASGLTPLGFMLAILRDENASTEDRRWAAQHAAPYCHPRLAQQRFEGAGGTNIIVEIVRFTDVEEEAAGGAQLGADAHEVTDDNAVIPFVPLPHATERH